MTLDDKLRVIVGDLEAHLRVSMSFDEARNGWVWSRAEWSLVITLDDDHGPMMELRDHGYVQCMPVTNDNALEVFEAMSDAGVRMEHCRRGVL